MDKGNNEIEDIDDWFDLYNNLCSWEIRLEAIDDKNIINRNELITLNWNVSGASLVSIDPILNEVENKGNEKLKISEDVLFQLKAKNKTSLIKKNIFVIV